MTKQKIRALLIPKSLLLNNSNEEQYLLQVQHRFLFFKWWETIKKGNNGIWHYGNAIYSKDKIEEIRQFCENNGNCEFSYGILT